MRKGLIAAVLISMLSSGSLARPAEDDSPPPDARLEGYTPDGSAAAAGTPPLVLTPASGYAGTWFLTVFCGAICIGVMFKNGKRSHLD